MKKEEKKYGLLKGILLLILVAIALTWIIPNGDYQGTEYVTQSILYRIGLSDIPLLVYYGFYFALDKIVLLLAIGGFYGVLSNTPAYERIVSGIAAKIKNRKLFVVIMSVIIAALTSFLTQTFVVLIFVPFIISIMNRMKLDKMTILATTFGSMLVGILGATYGTDGLVAFNSYFASETFSINTTVLIRAGILVLGLILFNFITLTHMNKKDKDDTTTDMFAVLETKEEVKKDNKKKANMIPIIVVGVIVLLLAIAAFTNWSSWGVFTHTDDATGKVVTVFEDFHNEVMDIKIGKDFYVFNSILGTSMPALGSWDSIPISAVLLLASIVIALCYKIKLDKYINNFISGLKKMIKPSLIVAAAFVLLAVVYKSPFMPHIINKLLTMTNGFNFATMSISALISNIMHTDLGFTGYLIGSHLVQTYPEDISAIYVIFTSLYGFVQFFVPTSIVLGVGLVSLDVKYRDWLKYIFKFLVGMFICLLIIFVLIALI